MLRGDPSKLLTAAISLMIGASGWYYLFYSRAAERLGVVEPQPANQRRVRLRRFNGGVMLVLAVVLYAGTPMVDPAGRPATSLAILLAIIVLLGICVLLAWVDMRMTMQLRESRRKDRDNSTKH